MTLEKSIADTHELTLLPCRRFQQPKLFLVGHSWGSLLGVLTVQRHLELYRAYVGFGQAVDMREGERISYERTLARARRAGDTRSVARLEAIGAPPYMGKLRPKLMAQRRILAKYGGQIHGNAGGGMPTLLRSREYGWPDRMNVFRGIFANMRLMWPKIVGINLLVQAPRKELIWFERSAHFVNTEEADAFCRFFVDRLVQQTHLPAIAVAPAGPLPSAAAMRDEVHTVRAQALALTSVSASRPIKPCRGAASGDSMRSPCAGSADIGCGMLACKTTLKAEDLPDILAPLRSVIERAVPHGRQPGSRDPEARQKAPGAVNTAWAQREPEFTELCRDHPKLAKINHIQHLGALGKHFIEVCLDETGFVWFMLHSGSHGVGNFIGTMFIELAKQDAIRNQTHLPDRGLAYLVEGSGCFSDCVRAERWAQKFAAINREVMMKLVIEAAKTVIHKAQGTR